MAAMTVLPQRPPVTLGLGSFALHTGAVLTPEGWMPNVTVTVTDGRLTFVGPRADAPRTDSEDDLAGHWLTPGFVDAHWHLGAAKPDTAMADVDSRPYQGLIADAARLGDVIATGTTTVRCADGWFEGASALRRAVLERVVAGPRMVCAGAPLGSSGSAQNELLLARRSFGEGADGLVVGECSAPSGRETAVRIAVEEGSRRGAAVVVHPASVDEAVVAIRLGATVIEGVPAGGTGELLEALARASAVFVPLLGSSPEEGAARTVRDAYGRGIRIAVGSANVSLRTELAALSDAGLGAAALIDAVGANAARAVGLGGTLGQIAVGMVADLIAFSRDPRETNVLLDTEAIARVYRSSDEVVIGRA